MCIKISTFLLILAPMIMIQKGIISQNISNEDDAYDDEEEMNDVIVKKIHVSIGRTKFLTCPDLNGTAQYTWLKNNKSLEDSKHIELLNNGTELRVLVTSKNIGNYTCKCKVAGCISHQFQLLNVFDPRDQVIEDMDKEMKDDFIPTFNIFWWIFTILGIKCDDPYHLERQNFSTDFQKVSVTHTCELGKDLILPCLDEVAPDGENYIWLKNNKPLETTRTKKNDTRVRRGFLFITLQPEESEEQSGNYTCKCRVTSCIPYMHTYQVVVSPLKKDDPSDNKSNSVTDQTQTKSSIDWWNIFRVGLRIINLIIQD